MDPPEQPILSPEQILEQHETSGNVERRPPTAPEEQGDGDSILKASTNEFLTGIKQHIEQMARQSSSYTTECNTMIALLSASLRVLNFASEEQVIYIIEAVTIGGVVLKAYVAFKPYAAGEFVVFKDRLDLLAKWREELKTKEAEILKKFVSLGELLIKVAEKGSSNNSDWGPYKAQLVKIEVDMKVYITTADKHFIPELEKLVKSYKMKDEEYQQECKDTQSAWLKFVPGSFLTWWGALGLGTFLAWQFKEYGTSTVAKAVGSAAVVGPVVLGGWATMRYFSDININPQLKKFHAYLKDYEKSKNVLEVQLAGMGVWQVKKYLGDVTAAVQAEDNDDGEIRVITAEQGTDRFHGITESSADQTN